MYRVSTVKLFKKYYKKVKTLWVINIVLVMVWPIEYDPENNSYTWNKEYAPRLLTPSGIKITEISNLIENHSPTFPPYKTKVSIQSIKKSILSKIWIIIVVGISPIIWSSITFRLFQVISSGSRLLQGLELTILFLVILSLSFAGILPYALFKKFERKLDLVDQVDLLSKAVKDPQYQDINQFMEKYEDYLIWKKYDLRWDLPTLFPSVSVFDLFTIFLAMFNQIYILVWVISLFVIIAFPISELISNSYLLTIDVTIIVIIILFVTLGIRFGSQQIHDFEFSGPDFEKFAQLNILIALFGSMMLFIESLIFSNLTLVVLFPIVLIQLPLLSAFVTTKLIYLRRYLQIRYALGKQLEFARMSLKPKSNENMQSLLLRDALDRLDKQTVLPTSKLRSYLLIATAFVSLLIPIFTALLSSIGRFTDLFSLIFPK